MPFYQYICKTCNKEYDIIKSITDETPELCTECGKELNRMIGISTIKFSGGGWASDNYSKPSKPSTEEK